MDCLQLSVTNYSPSFVEENVGGAQTKMRVPHRYFCYGDVAAAILSLTTPSLLSPGGHQILALHGISTS